MTIYGIAAGLGTILDFYPDQPHYSIGGVTDTSREALFDEKFVLWDMI